MANREIKTDGGTAVERDVNTNGDFIGRDTISNTTSTNTNILEGSAIIAIIAVLALAAIVAIVVFVNKPVPLSAPTPTQVNPMPTYATTSTSVFPTLTVTEEKYIASSPTLTVTQLLQLTSQGGNNIQPSVSFQNDKITFISDRDGNREIYVMDWDGQNQQRLTFTSNIIEDLPSFSPTGEQIVFGYSDGNNEEIAIINSDGTNLINLTNLPTSNEGRPRFDRSGLLVFDSNKTGNYEIYLASLVSNQLNIKEQVTDRQGRFSRLGSISPLGNSIIFRSEVPGLLTETSGIYMVTLKSKELRNLSGTQVFYYPSISPDGEEIICTSDTIGNRDIYVLSIQDEVLRRVVNDTAIDDYPTFSPDGEWIVFSSTRQENQFNIFRQEYN